MSSEQKQPESKLLPESEIERIQKSVADVGFGYNTQDLPRRYAKDVRLLLAERDELILLLAAVNKELTQIRQITKELVEDEQRNG